MLFLLELKYLFLILIESKLLSSLDRKIINGNLDDHMTYVAQIKLVQEISQRLCVTFFVTDVHLLAPAHCIKPYETLFKKNEISNEQVDCKIKVFTDRTQEDIDSIFTHPKFRQNKLFSYNIGFVSVSCLKIRRVTQENGLRECCIFVFHLAILL